MSDSDNLKDETYLKQLKRHSDMVKLITQIQERYERGEKIDYHELEKIAEAFQLSFEDISVSDLADISVSGIDYNDDTEIKTLPKIKKKPNSSTEKIAKSKIKEEQDESEIQKVFEIEDQKYQEMMKRSDLTDQELHEICDFYHVDFEDLKAEREENKLRKNEEVTSNQRTYLNDKKRKNKIKNIFKIKKK